MIHNFQLNIPTQTDLKRLVLDIKNKFLTGYLNYEDKFFSKASIKVWKLAYKITGRCGSQLNSHFPILGNKLWKTTRRKGIITKTCLVCGKKYKMADKNAVSFKNYSNIGREADMNNLVRMGKTATNEAEKKAVAHAKHKLIHEDKRVRAMREDLIKATRDNDHQKIKEIHNYVDSHRAYRNE